MTNFLKINIKIYYTKYNENVIKKELLIKLLNDNLNMKPIPFFDIKLKRVIYW